MVKNLPANAGYMQETWVQSLVGKTRVGNGNPLKYPCLENPIDRGTWQPKVPRIAKSQTWLKWLSTHKPSQWSCSHTCIWLPEKVELWLYGSLLAKWCLCFFNMLSRFLIAFLPRSKRLNFMAAVIVHSDFGAQENKTCHCFHVFPICHKAMCLCLILVPFSS